MYIDPRHLEQIAAIVDCGTLADAARVLRTSQPALSRLISSLEARLNVTLFERNIRPMVATEMGRLLADQGRVVHAARMRAAEEISLGIGGMIGELKIGAPPFMCARLVREVLADFLRARPNTEVTLTSGYYPKLEQGVLLNKIDIAICPLGLVVAPRLDLHMEPLFRNTLVVVCSAANPLVGQDAITASDLEQAHWIGHSRESMLRQEMDSALAALGAIRLRYGFQSESVGAILDLLRVSDFLCVLPRYALPVSLDGTGLAVLPVKLGPQRRVVGLLTRQDAGNRPVLDAFKDILRNYVRAMPQL